MTETAHTVVLTFGDPDPAIRDAIRADLLDVVDIINGIRTFPITVVGNLSGEGTYDGTTEYSGALVIIEVDSVALRTLRVAAQNACVTFNQECIGLIVGAENSLVWNPNL